MATQANLQIVNLNGGTIKPGTQGWAFPAGSKVLTASNFFCLSITCEVQGARVHIASFGRQLDSSGNYRPIARISNLGKDAVPFKVYALVDAAGDVQAGSEAATELSD